MNHTKRVVDLGAIYLETLRSGSWYSLEKEFTKFINMKQRMVLHLNVIVVNGCSLAMRHQRCHVAE